MSLHKKRIGVLSAMITGIVAVSGPVDASSQGKLSAFGSAGSVDIRLHIPQQIRVAEWVDKYLDSGVVHKRICITASSAYQLAVVGKVESALFSQSGDQACFDKGRKGNLAALTLSASAGVFTLLVGPE